MDQYIYIPVSTYIQSLYSKHDKKEGDFLEKKS